MVTREDQVEQSVQDYLRAGLEARGYMNAPNPVVKMRDAFPTPNERAEPLKTNVVAVGFNFDDGGRFVELGSDLTRRIYSIEFWTFGRTNGDGRNVAHTVRAIIEDADGGLIPLKDVGTDGQPVIDKLQIDDERRAAVARQIASEPRPWDLYVYTTTVRLIDWYYPSAVN